MITITFIYKKKHTLRIHADNKQQSPNLRTPVENYKNLFAHNVMRDVNNVPISSASAALWCGGNGLSVLQSLK